MLLALTLCNYRSFATEATLDLTARSFRRNVPADGDWAGVTERAVAIFGANASGKSTVIRAVGQLMDAVRESLRTAEPVKALRDPHKRSPDEDTVFETDYADARAGIRFRWVLRLDDAGIVEESLKANHTGHWRSVFERRRNDIDFGAHSDIPRAARDNLREFLDEWTLVLSAWSRARTRGRYYGAVSWWTDGLHVLGVLGTRDHEHPGAMALADHPSWSGAGRQVMQAADVGLTGLRVDLEETPPETAERIRQLNRLLAGEDVDREPDIDADVRKVIEHRLVFTHGSGEQAFELPEHEESSGTRVWFDLSLRVVFALATGSVLCVDELDESLHPRLTNYLVSLFTSPGSNPSGAQLLFTAHDVTLLGNQLDSGLSRSAVWLTEKVGSRSSLIALDEFPLAKNHNIARRYLSGVYGAVPEPDPGLVREIRKLRREFLEFVGG